MDMDDDNSFWIKLADLMTKEVEQLLASADDTVSADKLANLGAPLIWCAAMTAVSAHADREQFLFICGQLYDKSQIFYATGEPMSVLFAPDVHRGDA